jgi:glutamine amidotransferase
MMIAIVDYDIGNLSAVANMLHRLGAACQITADPEQIEHADRIILPGNGDFDACMRNLRATGLIPVLEKRVLGQKTPLLGICVGAQMLGKSSREGQERGLGWIDMSAERFPDLPGLPVPHMGWRSVIPTSREHPLAEGLEADTRFYFVHSFYLRPAQLEDSILQAEYGIPFTAAIARGNIAGVQFHPEKSHRFGKQLLSRFLEWN